MSDEQRVSDEQPMSVSKESVKGLPPVPGGYTLESLWQEHAALIYAHNAAQDQIALLQRQIAFLREVNQGLIAGIQDGAAMYQALQAERDQLQRRVDHLLISLQIFGNLTVVYGEEKQGKASVVCPDCMHEHKLGDGAIEVGARRAYRCPKCKASVSVIFGFEGDQIIEVSDRVSLQEGREMLERQDAQERYAQEGW